MVDAIWDNEILSLTVKFKIQFLRMASFGFMGNLYICERKENKMTQSNDKFHPNSK